MRTNPPPFHMAMPVLDLESTRNFYQNIMGCTAGREAEKWIDFDFFGHQLSFHVKPEAIGMAATNTVDGNDVPVAHFGAILPWDDWHKLAERLKSNGTAFIIDPYIRFKGQAGEQATMFFLDPSKNALEFKSFKDEKKIFAR